MDWRRAEAWVDEETNPKSFRLYSESSLGSAPGPDKICLCDTAHTTPALRVEIRLGWRTATGAAQVSLTRAYRKLQAQGLSSNEFTGGCRSHGAAN
jgi:hypothetical protein